MLRFVHPAIDQIFCHAFGKRSSNTLPRSGALGVIRRPCLLTRHILLQGEKSGADQARGSWFVSVCLFVAVPAERLRQTAPCRRAWHGDGRAKASNVCVRCLRRSLPWSPPGLELGSAALPRKPVHA